MTKCSDYIKSEFPLIDEDLKRYVEGKHEFRVVRDVVQCRPFPDVLENGAEDFENSEEVYEAVGEVLQEIACDKGEAEIRLGGLESVDTMAAVPNLVCGGKELLRMELLDEMF